MTQEHDKSRGSTATPFADDAVLPLLEDFSIPAWSSDEDGDYRYCNAAWLALTDCAPAGRFDAPPLFDRVHPDDRAAFTQAMETARQHRAPFRRRYRLRHRDGGYRWVMDYGVPRHGAKGYMGFTFPSDTGQAGADAPPVPVQDALGITQNTLTEEKLCRSDRRLARTQRLAGIGDWEWNRESGQFHCSDELRAIFGLVDDPVTVTHQTLLDAIHTEDRDFVTLQFNTAIEARRPFSIDHRIVRPDGTVRIVHAEAEAAPASAGCTTCLYGTFQDITSLRRTERSLVRLNRTLFVLRECNNALTTADSEHDLTTRICQNVVGIGGYRMAWIGYAEHDEERTVRVVAQAGHDAGYTGKLRVTWSDAPQGSGPSGTAIRTRQPVIVRNTATDPLFEPWRQEALARNYRSVISLPLVLDGQSLGALTIYSDVTDTFDTEEVNLLAELAKDVAFGIRSFRLHEERRRAEEMLRLRDRAIESSSNGITITETYVEDGHPLNRIIYVNPAYERITGYSRDEVIGRTPVFLRGHDTDQPGLEEIRAALREQREGSAVLKNYRKDGALFWNELRVAPVRNDAGTVTHYVGVLTDITERKQYEQQLEYQANHDGLTALPNRNLLQDRLLQAIAYAKRHNSAAAVLFLDLDNFKYINDSLGHGAGDLVLTHVAARLTACIREGDTVARQSGDEFVIILNEVGGYDDVSAITQRILHALAQPMAVLNHELYVTCSIGVSLYPRDGEDVQTLLKHADLAMYRAKEHGRNNFQFFKEDMNARILERLVMESALRRALERNEFQLVYQPQVDLQTGRIIGLEALLRWHNPELGAVSPVRFIPVAEETGLIVPVGEWVLRTACLQIRAWRDAGLAVVPVAVNLSARQFRHQDLPLVIARTLHSTGVAAELIELEITEGTMMESSDAAITTMQALKDMGLHLSIDDFGTGYSSLGYLKRFPLDRLKIDRSFVQEVTTDPDDAAIARAIIAMAHSLNLRVIAEGVETAEQLRYLQTHQCDELQGYYFSKPLPPEEIAEMLREDRRLALQAG